MLQYNTLKNIAFIVQTCIVQTKKQELAGLLPKAQVDQSVAEPIPEKHLGSDLEDCSYVN